MPCYKLGVKFERDDILKLFLNSLKSGFYFGVLEEGKVVAGDPFHLLYRDPHNVTVSDITRLYSIDKSNHQLKQRAIAVQALPESWKDYFSKQLHSSENRRDT
jgi:MOSC domain-containing protein YiiM